MTEHASLEGLHELLKAAGWSFSTLASGSDEWYSNFPRYDGMCAYMCHALEFNIKKPKWNAKGVFS